MWQSVRPLASKKTVSIGPCSGSKDVFFSFTPLFKFSRERNPFDLPSIQFQSRRSAAPLPRWQTSHYNTAGRYPGTNTNHRVKSKVTGLLLLTWSFQRLSLTFGAIFSIWKRRFLTKNKMRLILVPLLFVLVASGPDLFTQRKQFHGKTSFSYFFLTKML